jgi:hypothetical protein
MILYNIKVKCLKFELYLYQYTFHFS